MKCSRKQLVSVASWVFFVFVLWREVGDKDNQTRHTNRSQEYRKAFQDHVDNNSNSNTTNDFRSDEGTNLKLKKTTEKTFNRMNGTTDLTTMASFKLRFDWTTLEPVSTLAKRMDQHQRNCSLPLGDFSFRNQGLGSDLHHWGQALCNGMIKGLRIRSAHPWVYYDQETCNNTHDRLSPITCYFPRSELQCPGDTAIANVHPTYNLKLSFIPLEVIEAKLTYSYNGTLDVLSLSNGESNGIVERECESIEAEFGRPILRAAGTELLFSRVSPLLQREAERQLALVFKDAGSVPSDLITVHIRWGDKIRSEMRKVTIPQYIAAVHKILEARGDRDSNANIFLATEDPEAHMKFTRDIPKNWKVYVDQYFVEYLPHRQDNYSYHSVIAEKLHGKIGLIALGSLLVALEANDYVLTTASNWSRMINELRKGILDPRCNNCTRLIDLRQNKNGMGW